jgi:adenosylcobinamide-GDP ribazoletransferase
VITEWAHSAIEMLADLRAAFAFLTVLPAGYPEDRKPGYSFAYFPVVGLAIGAVLWLAAQISFPSPEVRAFVVLLAWVVLTGALHLDGFADACDALLATTSPEKRLAIMKDPHAGTWAVAGLVLLLLGKWVLLRETTGVLLLATPVVARWAMVVAAWCYPYARSSGLGAYFREGLGQAQLLFATLFTLLSVVALAWISHPFLPIVWIISLLTVLAFGRWAAHRLGGGLTGDVYGAICELTELLCLTVVFY